jgi:tetratricopeptide (TPR) repeat protein
VKEEPANPYALRNLAACLLVLGRNPVGRTVYLRKATAILPEDQQSWMNFGQALDLQNEVAEADAAYRKAIEINPGNQIAESAWRALTRIAKNSFNEAGIGLVRRDAVAYCVSGIEKFSKMRHVEIIRCASEIAAALAIKGIKVNCRDKSYTLKTMKGSFSALELMCYQFVACKRRGYLSQLWFDLSKEYEAALRISERG